MKKYRVEYRLRYPDDHVKILAENVSTLRTAISTMKALMDCRDALEEKVISVRILAMNENASPRVVFRWRDCGQEKKG